MQEDDSDENTQRVRIVLALSLASAAAPAQAVPVTVQLSGTGVALVSCTDGAACDSAALPGVVSFTTTNGTLTVHLGGTASGPPALHPFDMDLAYNLTANAGAGPGAFTIAASVSGLSGTSPGWLALVDGNQTNGATTQFAAYVDAGDTLFGQATPLCGAGPTADTSVHLSCTAGAFGDPSFSLTEVVTVTTLAGITSLSGDALLTAVPEPASFSSSGRGSRGAGLYGAAGLRSSPSDHT